MFDTDLDATLEAPVYSLTVSCHGYSHCPRAALLQLHCYSRALLERITERAFLHVSAQRAVFVSRYTVNGDTGTVVALLHNEEITCFSTNDVII